MDFEKAICISSEKIHHNIKNMEFQCHLECMSMHAGVDCSNHFTVLTAHEDFEMEWTMGRLCNENGCQLTDIKLEKCEKKIFGNFIIQEETEPGFIIYDRGTFNSSSLPFKEDFRGISCSSMGRIIIYINIYYVIDDKRFEKDDVVTDDYDKFFEFEQLRDVTFVFGNEKILAHKQIISARNEVFAKMFESEMIEKDNSKVKITDIEPDIFKLLLRFVYSGKIDSKNTNELLKLIVAADKYSVKNLVSICSHRLFENLAVDNVIYTLMIADLVKEDLLKTKCLDLIIENENLLDSESYTEILVKSGRTDLLTDILRRSLQKSGK